MEKTEVLLRDKLNDYYSDIFETKLFDEIVKVGHFEKIKSGTPMISIGQELTHIPLILSGAIKIIRKGFV